MLAECTSLLRWPELTVKCEIKLTLLPLLSLYKGMTQHFIAWNFAQFALIFLGTEMRLISDGKGRWKGRVTTSVNRFPYVVGTIKKIHVLHTKTGGERRESGERTTDKKKTHSIYSIKANDWLRTCTCTCICMCVFVCVWTFLYCICFFYFYFRALFS